MGVTYNGAVAGKPAVQGKHTAATATVVGGGAVAGSAVTAAHMATLQAAKTATAATAVADRAAADAAATGVALAAAKAALANAVAAQDAAAIAAANTALATAQANYNAHGTNVTAVASELAASNAAANVAAALGTPAVAATKAKLALENRITIDIGGSIETTSGLTFGGKLRIRSEDGGATGVNGARVYMATNGLEVGIGNIYGAINSMPNFYHSEIGLTGNGSGDVGGLVGWAFDSYSSTGGARGIELMYSTGGLSAHVSVTDSDLGSATNRTAAHLAYTAGDWTVAIGGQNSDKAAEDFTVVTAAGKVGDFGVGLSAMDADVGRQITLHGAATMGATTLQVFVSDSTAATATDTSYGVGVAYDLGGASLLAGVEKSLSGQTYADMGVSFSF